MVVFCLGDPGEKRKKLMSYKDGLYIDNDEIIASYPRGSRFCFVKSKAPFSDFSVWEYLSYSGALENRRALKLCEAKSMLLKAGLRVNPNKKMKRLDTVSLKAVRVAASLRPATKKIYINCDGMKYTASRRKKLSRLLEALTDYEIMISLSDIRFVPESGAILWYYEDSAHQNKISPVKSARETVKIKNC